MHHLTAPGKRIDAFAAGEDVAEVRLIAETAFETDLREAQAGVLDQLLGQGNALLTNPVLWREACAALERAREVTARQGASLCQFSDFQAVAQTLEDQLFNQFFALWAEAAGVGLARFAGRCAGGGVLWVSHGHCPVGEEKRWRPVRAISTVTLEKNSSALRASLLEAADAADELNVVNSMPEGVNTAHRCKCGQRRLAQDAHNGAGYNGPPLGLER
jgi:hypothetical protein